MARKQLSGINQNNTPLTNVPTPSAGSDAANKTYADTKVGKSTIAYNVRDFGAVGDGVTDDTAAFDAAMAAGSYVIVPESSQPYLIKYLSMPEKTTLVGQGRPQINVQRAGSSVISRIRTLCVLENVYLNSLDADLEWNRIGIESATNVVVRNCRIDGFRHDSVLPNAWGLFIDQSSYVRVENCIFDNNSQSDIAIVDSCSYIEIIGCKPADDTFVVNIEPNGSALSRKISVSECHITKAMSWDYSDIAAPIDNAVFKDCIIDLYRYGGGNIIFDNVYVTEIEPVSPNGTQYRAGKIANINSFGYGKDINPDPYFHKIVNFGGDIKQGWTFFYSPDGSTVNFSQDKRGKFLVLNANGINTTSSITRQFVVTPETLYSVRSLLNVYYPNTVNGTYQFALEYYDNTDTIIGTRDYIIVDKKSGISEAESEWDEKQFFFSTPALCTGVKIIVNNTRPDGTNLHKLNIQYLRINEVLLNSRNYIDEEMLSYDQNGPNLASLSPVGVGNNQSLVGQRIYAPNPGALGYTGWVCTVSGNPGTWEKISPTQSLIDAKVQVGGDIGGTITAPKTKRTVRATVTRDSTRFADYTSDGTADEVQIQAAVDAVYAAGGGTVELLAGTNPYRIAATIVVPENVTIRGERMARQSAGGVTLKTATSVNLTDMIQITGLTATDPVSNADLKHDIVFENLTFDGNNTTTNLVKLTNQDTVKFQNCRLIQATNSIVTVWDSTIDPVPATIPGGVYLNWCNVSANSGIAIDLQYQTQCWISNCWFTGSSVDTWIRFNASNKIHVTNCEFNAATQVLTFADTATMTCNDITVENCVFAINSGQKVINETRTNAGSARVTVSGTMASGGVYDKLVGAGNRVLINDIFTPLTVQSQATTDVTIRVKGVASQSGRYFEAQNSAGTGIAYLNSGGNWYVNNGSTSSVSYGFTSEINTGMYRVGAADLGWSLAGTLSMELSSAGLDVKTRKILNLTDPTSAQDAATKNYVDTNFVTPTGTQNLTNKTLTGVKIAGGGTGVANLQYETNSSTTTFTLPQVVYGAGNDTLVSQLHFQTLANKRITPRVGSTESSATPTINTDNVDAFKITALATNITSMTSGLSGTPTDFQKLMIRIKDNGTARSITWGASFASRGAALPTSTVISKTLTVGLVWNSDASTWDCVATAQEV